jgi:paraquat-inducible protein B
MSGAPTPHVSRARSFSLVWVVPVVALLVGGWMVFREVRSRGPEIEIDFADGTGIEANRTTLDYKGVTVGVVKDVTLKPDASGVLVRLRLERSAAALATADAQFWVVRPEIGLSGVRGLDLLLSGARLAIRPGKGPPATHFTALDRPPARENAAAGRAFLLEAEQLGSLNPGAPVFYREFKVGVVETSRLADNATSVLIRIRVYTPYLNLVRTNTRFWNAGGVSMKVNLLGAQVKSTSLESIFTGGVAFATPEERGGLAPLAPEGARFTLNPEAEKEWLKWRPTIPIESVEASPESEPSPQQRSNVVREALKP